MWHKAPYQLKRQRDWQGLNGKAVWYHTLVNTMTGDVVERCMYSTSPIPPKALRDLQATLNTRVMLDGKRS